MRTLSTILLAGLFASVAVGGVRVAHAEACDKENKDDPTAEKKQGKFHIEYVGGKPVTVIDNTIIVCGKVPKPSVVYVLIVKSIDYEWENLKQDFTPLILQSVKKAPF